jgi:solute carrier family 26 (sodium-independent sulfate anion transporter), member 11
LDFSSVNNVDITSVQLLIDVRNQLDRYATPDVVEWHFASINNRWTRRALASAGFGYPSPAHASVDGFRRWKPVFSVAEIGGSDSPAAFSEWEHNREETRRSQSQGHIDMEAEVKSAPKETARLAEAKERKVAVVHGVNRPLFHVDLTAAVQSAIRNIERRRSFTPNFHNDSQNLSEADGKDNAVQL